MKRFVKICAITGLILLLLGLGITAVSAAMGGRYTNSLPSRLASRVWHNHMPWLVRWGDDRADDWDDRDAWDNWDDWNNPDDPDDTDRSRGSSQIKTVSDPSYAQARKLDVDIDKGVIRVLEKEGISQIQVNVQDTYNRTQCYMDEFTLKVKRESGRSRSNEAPRIEILIPADTGLTNCPWIWAPRSARSLVSLSPNWRLTQELAPLHFQALSTGMWKSRQGWEM